VLHAYLVAIIDLIVNILCGASTAGKVDEDLFYSQNTQRLKGD
jgi:hypothetical protein